ARHGVVGRTEDDDQVAARAIENIRAVRCRHLGLDRASAGDDGWRSPTGKRGHDHWRRRRYELEGLRDNRRHIRIAAGLTRHVSGPNSVTIAGGRREPRVEITAAAGEGTSSRDF